VHKNVALHWFALFVACCTFVLIVAGGLVTSTQSGLSVPDWPTTYGHFMFSYPLDQMVGGILYEHSHRMIASVVGFLTIILAVWIWKRDDRRWMKVLGFVALGAVISQGILGGLTVRYLLPTAISVSHATLAQSFFGVVAAIALFTSRWWRLTEPVSNPATQQIPFLRIALVASVVVFVQLILGALMRHTHSGLAVPDFPFAYGQLLPSLSSDAIARYNELLLRTDVRVAADGAITSAQVLIHMFHRVWAVVAAGTVLWTAVRAIQLRRISNRLLILGSALIILIAVQITLGALTVLSLKAVDITTAHVATGALLLVTCVIAALHGVRLFGLKQREQAVYAFQPAGEARA
jgi:cytochrome c oxidase assembly protein subunit 15